MRRILLSPIWSRGLLLRELFLVILLAWGGQTLAVPLVESILPLSDETLRVWSAILISEIFGIGILLAGWHYLRPGKWTDCRWLTKSEWKLVLLGFGIAVLGSGVLGDLWKTVLDIFEIPYDEEQPIVDMFRRSAWGGKLLVAITAVLVVPFFEEVLFRKTIFAFFARWGNILAIVITSFIFGAVHFFLLGFPSLCWIGLVFQVIYLRSRNIMVSTAAHGLLNLCALAAAFFPSI